MTHLGLKEFPMGWCHLMRESDTFIFKRDDLTLWFKQENIHEVEWNEDKTLYSFPIYCREELPNGIAFSKECIKWIKGLMEKSLNREVKF